jgi:hypothetical protein
LFCKLLYPFEYIEELSHGKKGKCEKVNMSMDAFKNDKKL